MKDISVNVLEATRALVEKPMLATSAERFLILDSVKSKFNHLPQPTAFAKTLSTLLSRVSTPVEPHDLILGRCVDRLLTPDEELRFAEFIRHPDYPSRRVFLDSGHCTYSWDTVVELGLPGLRKKAMDSLSALGESDSDKRVFLCATVEIYDAIRDYMLRYADAAEAAGLASAAVITRSAATERPQSFLSALQLLWIITLIDCAYITENPTLTVGRLDQILYPLYLADLESGRLTEEQARLYITDYYCKHNLIMGRGEHQVGDETNSTTFRRILNFDAPQYLLLGGSDAEGRSVSNSLTELLAECIVPSFKNPVVVFRYVTGDDSAHPKLWHTLCEKALASSSLMFYNDSNVRSVLGRIGIPREESADYAHFGCNWCSTGDNGAWMCGGPGSDRYLAHLPPEERHLLPPMFMRCNSQHSWPEDLMAALHSLADSGDELSVDAIYSAFLERFGDFAQRKIDYLSKELKLRQRFPSKLMTFGDCFFKGSLDKAECFSASAKYHFEIMAFQMFGTVVDSIIAIDQLVLREKKLTLAELLAAVDADFEGYPDILALCRGAEKYGMDTELSNYHVKRLSREATDLVLSITAPYFASQRLFLFPCMQSDTWHLKYGETFGATPDGRRAYTPFSQNTRPSNGSCRNGLSAMLCSMLNLPSDGLTSGALNLDVSTKQFEGENGRLAFSALLSTYFNNGGLHAQVSALDEQTLRDAQLNPHMHRDIRVRVTGYSGVFVDICRRLQDDIIERMK